jgi:hypothetical protein
MTLVIKKNSNFGSTFKFIFLGFFMDIVDILALAMENVCSYFCFNHLYLFHNMFVAQIA